MAAKLEPLPPIDAMAALEARGRRLDPTDHWTDLWQDQHANAFTVARSAGFDVLSDIHEELTRTLSEGGTFRQFASELQPRLENKGWWGRREDGVQLGSMRRLRTIFDANLRVSYAAGAWTAFERNKATRPWLRYVCVLDGRARPEHLARHNLCLPVDHPYWDRWAPPCGWNCRCTLQSLNDRDVERMRGQLKFEPPPDETVVWLNRNTGQRFDIPKGIDPGWAHNPGKAGHRAVVQAEKLIEAPPQLAAARVSSPDWVARELADEFETWATKAAGGEPVEPIAFTVGAIDTKTLDALAARGVEPKSAAITVRQSALMHALRDSKAGWGSGAPISVLLRLPETLATARAVLRDKADGALLYVFDAGGPDQLGKLVIRIDFREKEKTAEGFRRPVVTNAFRTAGVVDRVALEDTNSYELLSGSL